VDRTVRARSGRRCRRARTRSSTPRGTLRHAVGDTDRDDSALGTRPRFAQPDQARPRLRAITSVGRSRPRRRGAAARIRAAFVVGRSSPSVARRASIRAVLLVARAALCLAELDPVRPDRHVAWARAVPGNSASAVRRALRRYCPRSGCLRRCRPGARRERDACALHPLSRGAPGAGELHGRRYGPQLLNPFVALLFAG